MLICGFSRTKFSLLINHLQKPQKLHTVKNFPTCSKTYMHLTSTNCQVLLITSLYGIVNSPPGLLIIANFWAENKVFNYVLSCVFLVVY